MTKSIINAAAMVALLVTANVRAELVTKYEGDQKAEYLQLAGASEWALIGSAEFDKAKAPYENMFTLANVFDQYRSEEEKVGDKVGSYSLDTYNGMGAGYTHALTNYVDEFTGFGNTPGMVFSHNSANYASISTPDGLIHSFSLEIGTHANESSTQGTVDIFITTSSGNVQRFQNVAYGWVGFTFAEGEYLTDIKISQNANNNTGFYFNFTPGDGTAAGLTPSDSADVAVAATPEPATLAIIGLGLAGLGLARARWRK